MNRIQQKEQNDIPKELRAMVPFLKLLPEKEMEKQFLKIWKKKTKCLDNPKENIKEIKKLQTNQTKKIFYKELTVYTWLDKVMQGQESKQFVKWFKTQYYKISLKSLGIFK
jgi:hypothetical protein